MYVSWGKIQYNEGSWIRSYGPGQQRSSGSGSARLPGQAPMASPRQISPGYETLIEPDGPIVFAGDHVSHIVAWQEGAALSALRAVQQVCDRVKAAKLADNGSAIKSE
jgi:monoamine oxidase